MEVDAEPVPPIDVGCSVLDGKEGRSEGQASNVESDPLENPDHKKERLMSKGPINVFILLPLCPTSNTHSRFCNLRVSRK